MMFDLRDIDNRIRIFNAAADDLDIQAEQIDRANCVQRAALRCYAHGLRDAARALGRMIEEEIETQARHAMERGMA